MKKPFQNLFAPISSIPESLQANYFPALDGLRGLAILMVLTAHFGINKYLYPYGIVIDSNIGVHMFFVISGFLITTLLLKEKLRNSHISLKYFYIRRALRIMPVAWLFLLVLMVLNTILHLHISTLDLIQTAAFVKNLPLSSSHYTAHFWSLAVEEQFYLVFPALLLWSIDGYFIIALIIITVVPAACMLGYYFPSVFAGNIFVRICMYSFWKGPVIILVGSVFSILMFKNMFLPGKRKANYWLGAALLFFAIIIRTPTFLFYEKYLSEYLSAILVAWSVLLVLQPGTILYRLLSYRLMIQTGILSYSLYIWQQLFVGTYAWQGWMQDLRNCPVWQLIILKVAVVFVIAAVSYRFERRFLKLKDRFKYDKVK